MMKASIVVVSFALVCTYVQAGHMEKMWEMMDEARSGRQDWYKARKSMEKWIDYDIESAPYETIKTTEDYEIRSYPAQKWMCSTSAIEGEHPTRDERSGNFMRLFSYISGSNKAGMRIKMTTPVTMTTMKSRDGNKFQMCFYIPSKHQKDAPESWDPSIQMENRPTLTAIVAQEGGYPDSYDYERMAMKLKKDAMRDGCNKFDFSHYYSAGYDAPMKFWDRRNEVAFVNKNPQSQDLNGRCEMQNDWY